jgi:hypothetical protein
MLHRASDFDRFFGKLRKLFGSKMQDVTGSWRKQRSEGLHDFYWNPNTNWVMKARRKTWAGYVPRMGEKRNVHGVLVGKTKKKKRRLEDLSVDGRIF